MSNNRNAQLYEQDFFEWSRTTAELVRSGQWESVDQESVAEEIESLGRSYRRELLSRLSLILAHRLKWDHQPEKRTPSWIHTIRTQRREILNLVKANPSLRPVIENPDFLQDAYESAVIHAAAETGILEYDFPKSCRYEPDSILFESFWDEDSRP